MGMANPDIRGSKKFSDTFTEGERFFLTGIRTVKVNTADYGEGEMVLLTVNGQDEELGIWGSYLTEQAHSADESDLNKWYQVNRRIVEGYSKRPVKVLDPAEAPGQTDDIPF